MTTTVPSDVFAVFNSAADVTAELGGGELVALLLAPSTDTEPVTSELGELVTSKLAATELLAVALLLGVALLLEELAAGVDELQAANMMPARARAAVVAAVFSVLIRVVLSSAIGVLPRG